MLQDLLLELRREMRSELNLLHRELREIERLTFNNLLGTILAAGAVFITLMIIIVLMLR